MNETNGLTRIVRWYRMDLHLHTPASDDYADKTTSYLAILKEAERRGLDIIAFTDHNTIAGYEALFDELDFLERLEQRGRLQEHEQEELAEYRRLLQKITLLPGFEFTCQFGSHILGIFPTGGHAVIPRIKTVLHQLGVPYEKMNMGIAGMPGTLPFLDAYKTIHEAGGIAIAAHINAPTGVLSIANNLPTGALRISATQSPYLHALEFSAFHSPQLQGFASPHWYNGTNLGYERHMFCLQGSDAHRPTQNPEDTMHRWGIGDRPNEVALPEPTFEALLALLNSNHFDLLRVPFVSDVVRYNRVADARAAGSSNRQIMLPTCLENPPLLCRHVVALANSGGGLVFIGMATDPQGAVEGLDDAAAHMRAFQQAMTQHVPVIPEWSVDILTYEGKEIAQIDVRSAARKPCFMREQGEVTIYIRHDGETIPATHEDIVEMLHSDEEDTPLGSHPTGTATLLAPGVEMPKSGVEISGVTLRGDTEYFKVIDLRTARESQVSEYTATSVWLYAIKLFQDARPHIHDLHHQMRWHGQLGLWRVYRDNSYYDQRNRAKCDLVYRNEEGRIERVFFAVAVGWIGSAWDALFEVEAPGGVTAERLPENTPVRWRGNMGIVAINPTADGAVCDLAFRNRQGRDLLYANVPAEALQEEWRALIEVELPRSGLEVVAVTENDAGTAYKFHNLGNRHVESRLWSPGMLKEGSLRHYALRMYVDYDRTLSDGQVTWIGNIGYLRRSYTAADLVYRDLHGVDHIYYGARWSDLNSEWLRLFDL
ncbi:MAG: RNA-binding domain-containing protein [Caldilineales bacterium]